MDTLNGKLEGSTDLTPEEKKALFIECLDKTVEGVVRVTLILGSEDGNGNYREDEILKRESSDIRPIIRFANGYAYIDLEFSDSDCIEIKSVAHIWEQFLNLSTEALKDEGRGLYDYVIDIVGTDDGHTYLMEIIDPVFFCKSDNKISLSLPIDRIYCSKFSTDFDKLKAEEEYNRMIEEEGWDSLG